MAARPLFGSLVLLLVSLAGCSGGGEEPGGSPSPTTDATGPPSSSASASATASSTPTPTPTSSSSSSSSPAQPQTIAKDVLDNSFPDGTFSLRVGDTVVWTHRGSNLHSVTSSGNFDSHPNCPPVCMLGGQTFTRTFEAAGTFQYVCKVHPSMTGTLTVNP